MPLTYPGKITHTVLGFHLFLPRNHLHPLLAPVQREWSEAEFRAPRRERLNDARDIVAHEAEAGDARVRLHDAPQRRLGVLRHRVRLVQYDELVRRAGVRLAVTACQLGLNQTKGEDSLRRDRGVPRRFSRKRLDLFPHNADASLVRRVELEHARAKEVWSEELAREGEDSA